jgi:hypothetical protein
MLHAIFKIRSNLFTYVKMAADVTRNCEKWLAVGCASLIYAIARVYRLGHRIAMIFKMTVINI